MRLSVISMDNSAFLWTIDKIFLIDKKRIDKISYQLIRLDNVHGDEERR